MSASRLPRWVEPVSLLLLGTVLVLRYPINFIIWPPFLMDFEVYRHVAERVVQGHGASLYAPATASEMMVFKYAPLWALLWLPLGWLSSHAGGVVWTGLDIAALLATLVLCGRVCRHVGLPYHPLTGVLVVLLLTSPLAEEMGNGQVNLLWGCLTVAAVFASVRGRPWTAALALSLAILLKLPALVFLLYLLLQRSWQLLGRTVVLLVGLTLAASMLIVPGDPLHLVAEWARALQHNGGNYAFIIGNQSAFAFLARFLTNDGYGLNVVSLTRQTVVWLAAAAGVAGIGLIGWPVPAAARSPARFVVDAAMLMVIMTMFSPTCWTATYSTLAFPLFVGCAVAARQLKPHHVDGPTMGLAALALLANFFTRQSAWRTLHIPPWRGEAYLFMVFMTLSWMGLALFALLWRQRALGTSGSSATGRRRIATQ